MRSFKEIHEAKQVGIIYHFTTVQALTWILGIDGKGNKGKKDAYGETIDYFGFLSMNNHFSCTRDYCLSSEESISRDKGYVVRIALDGNDISNQYKVKPITGLKDNDKEIFGTEKNFKRMKHKEEKEEVVYKKKDLNIKGMVVYNLKRYVLQVDIIKPESYDPLMDYDLEMIEKKLKQLKIPFNLSKKFKPVKKKPLKEDSVFELPKPLREKEEYISKVNKYIDLY